MNVDWESFDELVILFECGNYFGGECIIGFGYVDDICIGCLK